VRALRVLLPTGLVAVAAGCGAVAEVLPSQPISCGTAPPDLCAAVVQRAAAGLDLNLGAAGMAVGVDGTPCEGLGRMLFHAAWEAATDCWTVTFTGHGAEATGIVVRLPNGTLESEP